MIASFAQIRDSLEKIHHLCSSIQAEWLFGLIRGDLPLGDICEIGAFHGYITAAMAHACESSYRRVFSVDHMVGGQCDFPEDSRCIYEKFSENLVVRNLWNRVLPFPMKAQDAMKVFEVMRPVFALVYLDGDHNEQPVFEQLTKLDAFVPIGGIICGDDCLPADRPKSFHEMWNNDDIAEFYPKGVAQSVWNFFRRNPRYTPLRDVPGNQFGFRKSA